MKKLKIFYVVVVVCLFCFCGCRNSENAELQKQTEKLQEQNADVHTENVSVNEMYVECKTLIRDIPSINGECIKVFLEGGKVTVLERCEDPNWYHIEYDGKDGYVEGKYLSDTKPKPTPTVTPKPTPTAKQLLELNNFYINEINSAGGIEIKFSATNKSMKEIKYVRFYVQLFNAVGDKIEDEITDEHEVYVEVVGPVKYNQSIEYKDIIGYNDTCDRVEIDNITIIYMDGTTYSGWYGYYDER